MIGPMSLIIKVEDAQSVWVVASAAKITQFSVPYMTTGVTLVRRRDTLEQTVKPPVDRK